MKKIFFIILLLLMVSEIHAKDKLAGILKDLPNNPQVVSYAKKFIGTRYQLGASTKTTKKFDCSSFVKHIIKKTKHKNLPRTAQMQFKKVKKVKNPKIGDLVFFSSKNKKIGHVGIFIGKNKFIHASSGAKKVTISSLNKKYYKKHFKGYGRIK